MVYVCPTLYVTVCYVTGMLTPDGAYTESCIMHAAACLRQDKFILITTEHSESEIQENRFQKVLCEDHRR